MLFCQLNRAFSCSRVLLSPRSPHRTMVKDVVKTRTPKMQMWSPKNRPKHRGAVAAARGKAEEQNTVWSVRKHSTEICGHREPKPRGQAMWS